MISWEITSQEPVVEGSDTLTATEVDTLAREVVVDTLPDYASLAQLREEHYRLLTEVEEVVEEPFNPFLSVEEAYGPSSELVISQREVLPYDELLTDHPLFQGGVLLLAVAYALLVCAHLHDFFSLASLFGRGHGDQGRATPPRAVYTIATIGMLLLAALAVRLFEQGGITSVATPTLLLATLGAVVVVLLFQQLLHLLIGHITLSRGLMRALMQSKLLIFGVTTLIATPLLLLTLFTPPGEGMLWLYMLGVVTLGALFLFLKESFVLFLSQKISILHWFLYLCAVECFPISLIVLLVIRW